MEHAFPCGNPALDFVGTLRARRNAEPLEKLGSPRNLDAWFRESGVIDTDPGSRPQDVTAAIELREAIYALVAARLTHHEPDLRAMDVVNEFAAHPSTVPQLTPEGRRLEATPAQALSSVAREAVEILGGPDADLLKECGRPECTQVYLDRSRGSRREWCAMATCGNKMKAAAYRARQRGNPPLSPSRQVG
ncbi:ABATE domain-containing protein [Amycolatopsis sp. NPDC051373]|uniref:CGNR zinc finger domain-containing protein n=1 Tax=Amycolatopsis sp. NPDC051373 TaxID=3155801 RepID=UPI003450121F